MEISLTSVAPRTPASASSWGRAGGGWSAHVVVPVERRRRKLVLVRAEGREVVEGGERESGGGGGGGGYTVPAMEVTTFNQSYNDAAVADFPLWEKIGAIVRLGYGIGQCFPYSFFLFL